MNRNNEEAMRTPPSFFYDIFLIVTCGLYGAVSTLNATAQFEDNLLSILYELLFLVSVIMTLFAALLWSRKGDRMYRAYAFSAMVLGVLYLTVMLGFSTLDGPSHYSTAYRISSSVTFEDPLVRPAGLTAVRTVDYSLEDVNDVKTSLMPDDEESVPEVLGNPVKQTTYHAVKGQDKHYAFSTEPVTPAIPNVHTALVFYLPQAASFSIVCTPGLGTMGLLSLGRFLNLRCYVALTALVVRTTSFGKD